MEKTLTEDSVAKTIFRFSLPYLLSYFLQTLYGMASPAGSFLSVFICTVAYVLLKPGQKS